jgi:hypothetical protein
VRLKRNNLCIKGLGKQKGDARFACITFFIAVAINYLTTTNLIYAKKMHISFYEFNRKMVMLGFVPQRQAT